jgi:hypothetical protein
MSSFNLTRRRLPIGTTLAMGSSARMSKIVPRCEGRTSTSVPHPQSEMVGAAVLCGQIFEQPRRADEDYAACVIRERSGTTAEDGDACPRGTLTASSLSPLGVVGRIL